jgi:hypothetical protein
MVRKFAATVAAALIAMTASVKAMGTADFAGRTGFFDWRGSLVRRVRDGSRPRSAMDSVNLAPRLTGLVRWLFGLTNFTDAASSARR